jgi:hypothetical protein
VLLTIKTGATACFLAMLTACSSTAVQDVPLEYLDPQTAATIVAVEKPLVFARDRPEFAANVRDYATLVAVAVNRSGKIDFFLIAYFWSTVDTHGTTSASLLEQVPTIAADDRRIELKSRVGSPRDVGISIQPHRPPGVVTEPLVYATDLATLRFIAAAQQLDIRLGADSADSPYAIWNDQRPALTAFVTRMTGK